jgi:hypothetical protein
MASKSFFSSTRENLIFFGNYKSGGKSIKNLTGRESIYLGKKGKQIPKTISERRSSSMLERRDLQGLLQPELGRGLSRKDRHSSLS